MKNPARVKPKGRRTEKSKRNKPLIELQDEVNAKRRKKAQEKKVQEPKKKQADASKTKRQPRAKKCPYCHEEGHVIADCIYMKALLAGNAAKIDLNL